MACCFPFELDAAVSGLTSRSAPLRLVKYRLSVLQGETLIQQACEVQETRSVGAGGAIQLMLVPPKHLKGLDVEAIAGPVQCEEMYQYLFEAGGEGGKVERLDLGEVFPRLRPCASGTGAGDCPAGEARGSCGGGTLSADSGKRKHREPPQHTWPSPGYGRRTKAPKWCSVPANMRRTWSAFALGSGPSPVLHPQMHRINLGVLPVDSEAPQPADQLAVAAGGVDPGLHDSLGHGRTGGWILEPSLVSMRRPGLGRFSYHCCRLLPMSTKPMK